MNLHNPHRRLFVQQALASSVAGPLLASMSASALAAGAFTDYKALVCVFLFGGNDGHNTVIPLGSEYAAYAAARGNLATPEASVLPLNSLNLSGRIIGLAPQLPKLATLYNGTAANAFADRRLAVMANVGVLTQPTTLAQYRNRSVELPQQLFSHSDMQSHNQTANPNAFATKGWGGRLADVLSPNSGGGLIPVSISIGGSNIWMTAEQVLAFQMATTGPAKVDGYRFWDTATNFKAIFDNQVTMARRNILEDAWGDVMARAIDTSTAMSTALSANTTTAVTTVFPNTRLGNQLKMVARTIAARQAIGVKRQIFFVSLGGFDTHGSQLTDHPPLLTALDDALAAFYQSTVDLGVQDNVTSFTLSDFGRTLVSNGRGSDHGWGSHQLILGGAVQGGRVYGDFPVVSNGSTLTNVGEGRLLPTTAIEQYGATLSSWMGASNTELDAVFPLLNRFTVRNLGFV